MVTSLQNSSILPSTKRKPSSALPLPPFSSQHSDILCQHCWELVEEAVLTVLESKGHGNCRARVEEARASFKRQISALPRSSQESTSSSGSIRASSERLEKKDCCQKNVGKFGSHGHALPLASVRNITSPEQPSSDSSSYESASSQSGSLSHFKTFHSNASNVSSNTFGAQKRRSTDSNSSNKVLVDASQQTDTQSMQNESGSSKQNRDTRSGIKYNANASWKVEQACSPSRTPEGHPTTSLRSILLPERPLDLEDENRIQTVDSEALSRALTSRWSVSIDSLSRRSRGHESVDSEESGLDGESTYDGRGLKSFSSSAGTRGSLNVDAETAGSKSKISVRTLKGSYSRIETGNGIISPMSINSSSSRDYDSLKASTIGMMVSPMDSVGGLKGSDSVYCSPVFPEPSLTSRFSAFSDLNSTQTPPHDVNIDKVLSQGRRDSAGSLFSQLSHLTSPNEYGRGFTRYTDPVFGNRDGISHQLSPTEERSFKHFSHLSEESSASDSSSNETFQSQSSGSRRNTGDISDEESEADILEVEYEPENAEDSDLESLNFRNEIHPANSFTPTLVPFHQISIPISPFQLDFSRALSPTRSEGQFSIQSKSNITTPSLPQLPLPMDLLPSPTAADSDHSNLQIPEGESSVSSSKTTKVPIRNSSISPRKTKRTKGDSSDEISCCRSHKAANAVNFQRDSSVRLTSSSLIGL